MTVRAQGAGVVLGQVLAGAQQQAPDWPGDVGRRVLAQPPPPGPVGVVLEDVDGVPLGDHLGLVVVDDVQRILIEISLPLDVVGRRAPVGEPRAVAEVVVAEEVHRQLGREALAGPGQALEPDRQPLRGPGEPIQDGQRRGRHQRVHDGLLVEAHQVGDDVLLDLDQLRGPQRGHAEPSGPLLVGQVDADRVALAGRVEPGGVDPPAGDQIGVAGLGPADVRRERPGRRRADAADRGPQGVDIVQDRGLGPGCREDRRPELLVAGKLLGADRELRGPAVQPDDPLEPVPLLGAVADDRVALDEHGEVAELAGPVGCQAVQPATLRVLVVVDREIFGRARARVVVADGLGRHRVDRGEELLLDEVGSDLDVVRRLDLRDHRLRVARAGGGAVQVERMGMDQRAAEPGLDDGLGLRGLRPVDHEPTLAFGGVFRMLRLRTHEGPPCWDRGAGRG